MTDTQKQLYIVVSQSGSFPSRLLKLFTRAEYNHVSISLQEDLRYMYSFARRYAYNPFYGGFVVESPHFGTFKRFYNTKVVVVSVDIDRDTYLAIEDKLNFMAVEAKKYHYNYLGVLLAWIHVPLKRKNRYYCSEFVKEILQQYNISGAEHLQQVVRPMQFLELPHTPVYSGNLQEYATSSVVAM